VEDTLIDLIKLQFRKLPRPNHLSLDDQTIPFSGRCYFRQYVPSKPDPLRLKNFVMSASDGLVLDFHIFSGKGTVSDEDMQILGLDARIVKLLSETIPKNGTHVLHMDQFFTSCQMLLDVCHIFFMSKHKLA
jgi:hypothetical protein